MNINGVPFWYDRDNLDIFSREQPFSPIVNESSSLPIVYAINCSLH